MRLGVTALGILDIKDVGLMALDALGARAKPHAWNRCFLPLGGLGVDKLLGDQDEFGLGDDEDFCFRETRRMNNSRRLLMGLAPPLAQALTYSWVTVRCLAY